MEDRLARASAGLINQLRQEDLGIEYYIWRSRDDAKVRDAHAEYDDRVFRWDTPPDGGHPGQAHNCRCWAEPIASNVSDNVILANGTLTADSIPNNSGIVRRLSNGLLARTAAGAATYAAIEASNLLQEFTRAANDRHVRDAADHLGADLGTVEGILAAQAFALAKTLAENGYLTGSPERGARAVVIAEAIALYEMYQPGLFTLPTENAAEALTLGRSLAASALGALEANRLTPMDGDLSDGWVEVFPELTEDERRLGELPGFTPERLEQWLEVYAPEALGLPNHTGHAPPDDPTETIVSAPITGETGPNILEARPNGIFTTPGGAGVVPHGRNETGQEYIEGRKGHTGAQIDDIIADPNLELSGYQNAKGRRKGEIIILITGQDGNCIKLGEDGIIFAASNRHLPLSHPENDPDDIIAPLEK